MYSPESLREAGEQSVPVGLIIEVDFQGTVELAYIHLEELALQALCLESHPLRLKETIEQLVVADSLEDFDNFSLCCIVRASASTTLLRRSSPLDQRSSRRSGLLPSSLEAASRRLAAGHTKSNTRKWKGTGERKHFPWGDFASISQHVMCPE